MAAEGQAVTFNCGEVPSGQHSMPQEMTPEHIDRNNWTLVSFKN